MDPGLAFLVFGLGALALTAWWLIRLIEAVQIPDAQWAAAGQNKILHILLMALLGILGTIIYTVTARPELNRVGPPPPGHLPPPYR